MARRIVSWRPQPIGGTAQDQEAITDDDDDDDEHFWAKQAGRVCTITSSTIKKRQQQAQLAPGSQLLLVFVGLLAPLFNAPPAFSLDFFVRSRDLFRCLKRSLIVSRDLSIAIRRHCHFSRRFRLTSWCWPVADSEMIQSIAAPKLICGIWQVVAAAAAACSSE